MDSSPRSSSRELQGPRPAPLRVRKDSHKVRKPPVAPPPQPHHIPFRQQQQQQQSLHPAPLIIYTISPKVIHTSPDDFMTLVQRLTGSDNASASAAAAAATSSDIFDNSNGCGLISPAARYAVMDRITKFPNKPPSSYTTNQLHMIEDHVQHHAGGGGGRVEEQVDRIIIGSSSVLSFETSSSRQFVPASILSPGPSSLVPMTTSSFFSPLSSDPNSMSSFFQGLSPLMNQHAASGSSNNIANLMELGGGGAATRTHQLQGLSSPNYSILFSPSLISPTTSVDLFNNFPDF